MTIVALTNSTSPSTVERATDDQDPYERETQLNALAHNFDDHDHTAAKGLAVGRVQTSSAPAGAGQVRVNGDAYQWWGASAAAVRTAADLEGAQTVAGVKTFSAAPNASAGLYVNDTSNAKATLGLTVNQGAADDEALALKSSDVAVGITDVAETDTWFDALKAHATNGGAVLRGFSANVIGTEVQGFCTNEDTGKTTAATAPVMLRAFKKSGTGTTTMGANANLVAVIHGASTARFILDGDGDGHADVSWTTFDQYDDLALVEDIEGALLSREAAADPSGAMTARRKHLEATGVINPGSWHIEDGKPRAMVNFTRLAMLHHGSLIQVRQRFVAAEEKVARLEAEVADLKRLVAGLLPG